MRTAITIATVLLLPVLASAEMPSSLDRGVCISCMNAEADQQSERLRAMQNELEDGIRQRDVEDRLDRLEQQEQRERGKAFPSFWD